MALGDVDLDANAVHVSDSYLLQFCNLLSNSIGISEQWGYMEYGIIFKFIYVNNLAQNSGLRILISFICV
jgi:hypothetical protein